MVSVSRKAAGRFDGIRGDKKTGEGRLENGAGTSDNFGICYRKISNLEDSKKISLED